MRALAFVCLLFLPVLGQDGTASLTGKVRDIPGALALLRLVREPYSAVRATADDSGVYRFSDLQSGEYEMKIGSAGFETLTVRGIEISPGESKLLATLELMVSLVGDCRARAMPDYLRPLSTTDHTGSIHGGVGCSRDRCSPTRDRSRKPVSRWFVATGRTVARQRPTLTASSSSAISPRANSQSASVTPAFIHWRCRSSPSAKGSNLPTRLSTSIVAGSGIVPRGCAPGSRPATASSTRPNRPSFTRSFQTDNGWSLAVRNMLTALGIEKGIGFVS